MIPEKREADVFEIENLRIRKRIYKSEKAAALSVPAHDVKVDMSGAVLDVDANKRYSFSSPGNSCGAFVIMTLVISGRLTVYFITRCLPFFWSHDKF